MAILDGDDVVFIARASPTRIFSAGIDIGYRLRRFRVLGAFRLDHSVPSRVASVIVGLLRGSVSWLHRRVRCRRVINVISGTGVAILAR